MSLKVNISDQRSVQAAIDELDRRTRVLKGEGGQFSVYSNIDLKRRRVISPKKATKPTQVPNKAQVDASIQATTTSVIQQAGGSQILRMSQSLTGTQDGSNRRFTLPLTLMSGTEPVIYHENTRLEPVTGSPGATEYYREDSNILLGTAPESTETVVVDMHVPRPPNPVLDEIPDGDKDGSNTTFTLAHEPLAPSDIALYLGSTRMEFLVAGTPTTNQFTVSGKTLTLGQAPAADDELRADYSVRIYGGIRWGDELYGPKNGSNNRFMLDEIPLNNEIGVYLSGIRLVRTYSQVSVGTLEFRIDDGKTVVLGVAPPAGTTLYADYLIPYGGDIVHEGPGWITGTPVGDMYATVQCEFEQV